MKPVMRSADRRDIPALIAIDTVAPSQKERRNQIEAWAGNQMCHVAEVEGSIVAYGVLHDHFFGCAFIEMLMVAEDFRGKGIGSALIDHLKSACRKPKLFTSTNQSNLAMRSLLAKSGFRESGYIDNLDDDDRELVFFWAKKSG